MSREFPLPSEAVAAEIRLLESMSKRGESYADDAGRHGWRNPIRSDTGPLLTALVTACAPERILEVGTAHGLSALYLAKGLHAAQSPRIDTIEFDEGVASAAQARFDRLGVPVRVFAGEAMEVIGRQLEEPYGMVFLDAQKDHYGRQLEALLERELLEGGAVVLADNVIDREAECASLFALLEQRALPYQVIPTECGLLVARLPLALPAANAGWRPPDSLGARAVGRARCSRGARACVVDRGREAPG